MNINVSLPTIIPNQLQPQTESAQTDNRRGRTGPPAARAASNAESGVGSPEREIQSRSGLPPPHPRPRKRTGRPARPVAHRFVEATRRGASTTQEGRTAGAAKQQQRQVAALVEVRDLSKFASTSRRTRQPAASMREPHHRHQFSRGPDGKRYATGEKWSSTWGPFPGIPAATIAKMQQVRAAALAPR